MAHVGPPDKPDFGIEIGLHRFVLAAEGPVVLTPRDAQAPRLILPLPRRRVRLHQVGRHLELFKKPQEGIDAVQPVVIR